MIKRSVLVFFIILFLFNLTGCKKANIPAQYDDIIKKYRVAISENYNSNELAKLDMSGFIPEYLANGGSVGYCIFDINGDGSNELIIKAENDIYDFTDIIFAVYTLENGLPISLILSTQNDRYYFIESGKLLNIMSTDSYEIGWYVSSTDKEWWYYDAIEYNKSSDEWMKFTGNDYVKISEDESNQIKSQMKNMVKKLNTDGIIK